MSEQFTIKQERLSPEEDVDFLKRSDLGSQYPKERFEERISRLVCSVTVSLTARTGEGLLIGVLFAITDFSYWMFVTDLGVDRAYTRRGIGSALIDRAHQIAGGRENIALYLVANQNASAFYEKLGMKRSREVMELNNIDWTEFRVE